jgi:hypothetical protein
MATATATATAMAMAMAKAMATAMAMAARMFNCVQGIEPCECMGKGHQFQRLGF